jgi:hypothetical protein
VFDVASGAAGDRVEGVEEGDRTMCGTCTCGHEYDEHRVDWRGGHECEVHDCDCLCFEEGDDEEDDDYDDEDED